ncbi:GAF domain-containing sensor histidine kinase [Actinoplanes sp. TBRC 11911]|uniref:GAF domain-containing sensor histidine kinase n=1 Tax=Actinoplanes sp. TBRC 11911 TaxID=2729386 RepID=UPI0020070E38|nr:GAF domain-containing sensor histidine kinase [Actinoplanes sp. TBRC 11911]
MGIGSGVRPPWAGRGGFRGQVALWIVVAVAGLVLIGLVCAAARRADVFVLGLLIAVAVGVGAVTVSLARRATESERARGDLVDDQAALRRVATLVAGGAAPAAVFAAIADELALLIGAEASFVAKVDERADEADPWVTIVASYGRPVTTASVGMSFALKRGRLLRTAIDAGKPTRFVGEQLSDGPLSVVVAELGLRDAIAAPIFVGARLWGMTGVASTKDFQPAAESRIADFIELAATAIASTEASTEISRLADMHASLRRLALLIARGESPEVVYYAVTKEVLRYFGEGGTARLMRYEPDGTVTLLASAGATRPPVIVGAAWERRPPDGILETVRRTGRPARVDDYRTLANGQLLADAGFISAVGMPIHVSGRLWGLIAVGTGNGSLPPDLETRMTEFTDLVATAVGDAQSRSELALSRARIIAAADETRRRIERDMHDGIQQSLVSLTLRLRSEAMDAADRGESSDELAAGAEELATIVDQMRELSRGIHPAVLSDSGLSPALRALGRRSPLPVTIDLRIDGRLPLPVEVGAYYVVSEMLTNAVKHADASRVDVEAEVNDGVLTLSVRDDGIGGADPGRGTGLLGLRDRIEALAGTFDIDSPPGRGTTGTCRIPVVPPAS